MVEKATTLRRHRIITFQNIPYPINGTDSHTIGIDVAITQLVLHSRKIFFDPVYRTTRRSTSTSTLRRGFQTTPSARGSPAASALRSPTTRRAKPSRLTCERRLRYLLHLPCYRLSVMSMSYFVFDVTSLVL